LEPSFTALFRNALLRWDKADAFFSATIHGRSPLNHSTMRQLTLTLTALLLLGGSAFAGSFRVHYNMRGSGRDVTVQAESSSEARRTVMEMIPGSVVTGVHRRVK
jgi:hypothetical protein